MIDVFDTPKDPEKDVGIKMEENSDFEHWESDVEDATIPIASPEEEVVIEKFFSKNPKLKSPWPAGRDVSSFEIGSYEFHPEEPWIQTYSGRRFNPTNPISDAIVIQDIAHSLSMLCRFTGHCRQFYSVAQHCVLVSYICDEADALWGLIHDSSEAFLQDLPKPLKRSGKFESYIEFEKQMQLAICKRFELPETEPASVKKADTLLLTTEARDLMSPLHPDWKQPVEPLPFKIDPWDHDKAEDMFMKRFFELVGHPKSFGRYMASKYDR